MCLCLDVVTVDGCTDSGFDASDDVELLAVDSPLHHGRRHHRVGGILRLRRSSNDDLNVNDDDDDDDALLSLEHELTQRSLLINSLLTYYALIFCICVMSIYAGCHSLSS